MRTSYLRLTLISVLGFLWSSQGTAQITINGGNQTMTINAGTAGGQPTNVVNTSCSLSYQRQSKISKITVATSCPGQSFSLGVVATNVTKGVAAPQVTLVNGNPATDLVTSIPTTGSRNATCTLQFTASSTFSQGNSNDVGNDVHTITYTIQAQ